MGTRPRTRPDPRRCASAAGRGYCRFLLLLLLAAMIAVPAASELGVHAAHAQGWGFGFPWSERPRERVERPRRPPRQDGFFLWGRGGWGGVFRPPADVPSEPRQRPRTGDGGRPRMGDGVRPRTGEGGGGKAPAHRKPETEPAKWVLVLGDSMADWLAYGLEEAFADKNELGVIRRHRPGAGLIRNEPREYDWALGVRDALQAERADFVVMMIGLGDRRPIRERQQRAGPGRNGDAGQSAETPNERQRSGAIVSHEFRSPRWSELYAKRIDEVAAALKAKRVPVIWVGLPPIRGPKARSDLAFLNETFKARAEKAGIAYVDVWEGFVTEDGDFSSYGPDVIGQVRRLRSSDGVHFTRAGARKLAHYVDREIKRLLSRETPVALPIPAEPTGPGAAPAGPAARPAVGPVIPLTGAAPAAENLLGGGAQDAPARDPLVEKVLVRGEPLPPEAGRADNFAWPPPAAVAAGAAPQPPIAAGAAAGPEQRPTQAAARPAGPTP